MALSKKSLTWIFIVAVIVIVGGIAIYIFRCSIFKNLSSCVPDPNLSNTPVPQGSPTPKWIPETDPYNVGMYGPKIKALQAAMGFTGTDLDGKFGNDTKNAITGKGYAVPLSQSDYNTIVNTSGGSAGQNIKGAYAKYDNVIVRNKDLSAHHTAKKGDWLGTVTGESNDYSYWELDGTYYVIKNMVTIKS